MPTYNQLIKEVRKDKKKKSKVRALKGNPQLRGICLKVLMMRPKKPNSAQRRIAIVRLSNGERITAYIGGGWHNLQEHSAVLVRGGRTPDLPGVKYKLIRNKYDLLPPVIVLSNGHSKVGFKKSVLEEVRKHHAAKKTNN